MTFRTLQVKFLFCKVGSLIIDAYIMSDGFKFRDEGTLSLKLFSQSESICNQTQFHYEKNLKQHRVLMTNNSNSLYFYEPFSSKALCFQLILLET